MLTLSNSFPFEFSALLSPAFFKTNTLGQLSRNKCPVFGMSKWVIIPGSEVYSTTKLTILVILREPETAQCIFSEKSPLEALGKLKREKSKSNCCRADSEVLGTVGVAWLIFVLYYYTHKKYRLVTL